jgi:hypothetical protein
MSTDALPADVLAAPVSATKLKRLRQAFDVACSELGIGLKDLDVPSREKLVKRAMRIAHANEPRSDDA